MDDGNKPKRRAKGSGSYRSIQNNLKTEGKPYCTSKCKVIPAKTQPSDQVISIIIHNIRTI